MPLDIIYIHDQEDDLLTNESEILVDTTYSSYKYLCCFPLYRVKFNERKEIKIREITYKSLKNWQVDRVDRTSNRITSELPSRLSYESMPLSHDP